MLMNNFFTSGTTTTGEVDPAVYADFSALPAGEKIRFYRNGAQWAEFSTTGSTQFSIEDISRLARPTSAPTSTTLGVDMTYTVTQIDAAGNESAVSSVNSRTININYQTCSQTRATALTGTSNTTHNNWPSGTSQCTGCHSVATATGFIAAPAFGTTTRQFYWCRKP